MSTTDHPGVTLSLMDPAVQRCPYPFYEQLHAQRLEVAGWEPMAGS